jgi:hypothetical protein
MIEDYFQIRVRLLIEAAPTQPLAVAGTERRQRTGSRFVSREEGAKMPDKTEGGHAEVDAQTTQADHGGRVCECASSLSRNSVNYGGLVIVVSFSLKNCHTFRIPL